MKTAQVTDLINRRFVSFGDLKGLRARGYVRDSSKDQADGFSPEVQRSREEAFARDHGLLWEAKVYRRICQWSVGVEALTVSAGG